MIALPEDVTAKLADPRWRLANLYTIVDKNADVVPFRLNDAQRHLLDHLHSRVLILKARQLGFSTLIQIIGLDQALWNPNYTVGIVADTLENAERFLTRIRFAYDQLPRALRNATRIVSANASMLVFSNGSSIRVDTSMRSSTLQFLHVSEFAKICAKWPDKATEVVTGTLPALAPGGLGFIESTAEGNEGYFHDMCRAAEARQLAGVQLTPVTFKLLFYPWVAATEYAIDPTGMAFTVQDIEYFERLERELGVEIPLARRAWYVAQREVLGADRMLQEYPATVDEAFYHSVEGQYYADEMRRAYREQRIGQFSYEPQHPVHTSWDLGGNNETAIWFFQVIRGRLRFIDYLEASGEAFGYYVAALQNRGYVWDRHWLPHDAMHRRQQGLALKSPLDMLTELAPGWQFEIIDRIPDIGTGIQQVRDMFPICEFNRATCELGLKRLDNYRREWNDRLGVWKSTPRHDVNSNGADAFRGVAQAYAAGLLPLHSGGREAKRVLRLRSWQTI